MKEKYHRIIWIFSSSLHKFFGSILHGNKTSFWAIQIENTVVLEPDSPRFLPPPLSCCQVRHWIQKMIFGVYLNEKNYIVADE